MTLKEQYENLNSTEISFELINAVKSSNYAKIKFMIEASYISISEKNIIAAMKRCCIDDNLKIFKYLMHKQKIVEFEGKKNILEIIIFASSERTTRIVDYVFKSKKIKSDFTQIDIEYAMEKISSFESAYYLIKKSSIDFNKIIHKNDDAYIRNAVVEGNFEIVSFLMKNYNVNMTPFKNLTIFYSENNIKENKIKDLIKKQELSLNLEKMLPTSKRKLKKLKL